MANARSAAQSGDERSRPRQSTFGGLSAGMIERGRVPPEVLYGAEAAAKEAEQDTEHAPAIEDFSERVVVQLDTAKRAAVEAEERTRTRQSTFGGLSAGMIERGTVPAHVLFGSHELTEEQIELLLLPHEAVEPHPALVEPEEPVAEAPRAAVEVDEDLDAEPVDDEVTEYLASYFEPTEVAAAVEPTPEPETVEAESVEPMAEDVSPPEAPAPVVEAVAPVEELPVAEAVEPSPEPTLEPIPDPLSVVAAPIVLAPRRRSVASGIAAWAAAAVLAVAALGWTLSRAPTPAPTAMTPPERPWTADTLVANVAALQPDALEPMPPDAATPPAVAAAPVIEPAPVVVAEPPVAPVVVASQPVAPPVAAPEPPAPVVAPAVAAVEPAPAPVRADPPAAVVAAAPVAPPPVAAPAPPPAAPAGATQETADLVWRGDDFLRTGDIATARLFYERAAKAGDPQAMVALAQTYDAAVLQQMGARGVRPDAEKAQRWYARAVEVQLRAASGETRP